MQTILKVKAGDKALIAGIGVDDTLFTFGSIEAFAAANTRFATVEEQIARAVKNGHELAWANPDACVIVDSKTYPGFYEARAAERAAAHHLSAGDHVEIEGRVYRLAKAANRNVSLTEVK